MRPKPERRGVPRCLWECGVLPMPEPGDLPVAPPALPTGREPSRARLLPGVVVYTDASAIRPKDPCLRRAACAVWVGEGSVHNAAWPLPGPVQTVYPAELYALVLGAVAPGAAT